MSDWEELAAQYESPAPVVLASAGSRRWSDDEDDNVLDSWEDEKTVCKNKKPVKDNKTDSNATSCPVESESDRKARILKEITASEEKNIQDLFHETPNGEFYDKFLHVLVSAVQKTKDHGLYTVFLERLVRALYSDAGIEQIRKVAKMLDSIANEKQRIEKEKLKKKKSSKQQLRVEHNLFDEEEIDFDYDDGFM